MIDVSENEIENKIKIAKRQVARPPSSKQFLSLTHAIKKSSLRQLGIICTAAVAAFSIEDSWRLQLSNQYHESPNTGKETSKNASEENESIRH